MRAARKEYHGMGGVGMRIGGRVMEEWAFLSEYRGVGPLFVGWRVMESRSKYFLPWKGRKLFGDQDVSKRESVAGEALLLKKFNYYLSFEIFIKFSYIYIEIKNIYIYLYFFLIDIFLINV